MKKSGKTLLKVVLGMGIAGGILMLVGIGMGATWKEAGKEVILAVEDREGRYVFGTHEDHENYEDHESYEDHGSREAVRAGDTEQIPADRVTSMDLDAGGAGIYVASWEEDYIGIRTAGKLRKYKTKLLRDGTYKLEIDSEHRNASGMVEIFVPEGKVFDEIVLDVGAGEAEFKGISVNRLVGEVGAGVLNFNGDIRKEGKVDCGVGEADLHLKGNPEDYDYKLSCGIGEIELNKETSLSGFAGEKSVDNGADRLIKLECGVGKIKLQVEE